MTETLLTQEWEEDVGHRDNLARCAEMASYYGLRILSFTELIRAMPKFPTKAEHELNLAITNLIKAREALNQKPRKK
jgi:hypothetical protein